MTRSPLEFDLVRCTVESPRRNKSHGSVLDLARLTPGLDSEHSAERGDLNRSENGFLVSWCYHRVVRRTP